MIIKKQSAYHAAILVALLWLVAVPAAAEEQPPDKAEPTAASESAGGAAELAALLQDPLASIAALMTDNTISFRTGPTNDKAYEFNLQPVYSINFPDLGWTVLPRAMIPILGVKPGADLPRLADDGITIEEPGQKGRQWGLSDIVTQIFFTPMGQKGIKLGGGPVLSWKTRTNDDLKGPGWGAGPVGVLVGGGQVFNYAVIAGHLWSYDGNFSTSFVQPMLYYNFESLPGAFVNYNNTISYDVKATGDFDDKWTIPLGLGVGQVFDMGGGHGFELSLGGYHLPKNWGRPKGGAEYQLKIGLKVSCHQMRHTMATQMLNAGAELVTIQDLLGHSSIRTTERYSKVSNLKVQQDYHKAMEVVMQRTGGNP